MKTQEKITEKIIRRVRAIKDQKFLHDILDYVSREAKNRKIELQQLEDEIMEAVDNLNKVKKGELKARPARDLLDEL